MPFCRECGAPVNEAARFCAACGKPQESVESVATVESASSGGVTAPPAEVEAKARTDIAGAIITMFGGGMLVLSALLPWMTAQALMITINRNAFQLGDRMGFSADGLVLTLLGLVAILIGITRAVRTSLPPFIQRSPIIVGVFAVFVPLLRIGSINALANQVSSASGLASASVGFGLWLAIFAAVITVVGGIVLRKAAVTEASSTLPLNIARAVGQRSAVRCRRDGTGGRSRGAFGAGLV